MKIVALLLTITTPALAANEASIYGGKDGLCGSLTANGEHVHCGELTAAHKSLPFGTRVRVCFRQCAVVRINDRGPYVRGRVIDLTPAAAKAIGLSAERGHAPVTLQVIR